MLEYLIQYLNMQFLKNKNFEMCGGIFGGSVDNFDRRFEKKLRCIFDQWSKLHFNLDVQPEIQILNWI
jgi:hypothetical protein